MKAPVRPNAENHLLATPTGRGDADSATQDFDERVRQGVVQILTRRCPFCGVTHGVAAPLDLHPGDDIQINRRLTEREERCWWALGGRVFEDEGGDHG